MTGTPRLIDTKYNFIIWILFIKWHIIPAAVLINRCSFSEIFLKKQDRPKKMGCYCLLQHIFRKVTRHDFRESKSRKKNEFALMSSHIFRFDQDRPTHPPTFRLCTRTVRVLKSNSAGVKFTYRLQWLFAKGERESVSSTVIHILNS